MVKRTCSLPDCERGHRARGLCGTHYNQLMYRPDQRHRRTAAACAMCGSSLTRRVDRRRAPCCSPECRRLLQFGARPASFQYDWNQDAQARARKYGCRLIENVDRDTVLTRDLHRCYICGIDTSRTTDPFDPSSATIDHVVPLTAGGSHSMSNVRCCCLSCNSSKADRVGGDPLPTLV